MNTQNQDETWRDLDELYMDLGEWISFFQELLEDDDFESPSQIVFGNLTIKQLIKMIKKDITKYEKLLKMVKKSNKQFMKIVNESIKNLERRIHHESI